MIRPRFSDIPVLWLADSSCRDLYVLNTSVADWEAFLDLATLYPFDYTYDGEPRELPSVAQVFRDQDGTHLLRIHLDAVTLNCHFFDEDEIELDLDPRQVVSGEQHEQVLDFMERLGSALSKTVLLTPENSRNQPLLTYSAESSTWASRRV